MNYQVGDLVIYAKYIYNDDCIIVDTEYLPCKIIHRNVSPMVTMYTLDKLNSGWRYEGVIADSLRPMSKMDRLLYF